jgi:hypothetical protein
MIISNQKIQAVARDLGNRLAVRFQNNAEAGGVTTISTPKILTAANLFICLTVLRTWRRQPRHSRLFATDFHGQQ